MSKKEKSINANLKEAAESSNRGSKSSIDLTNVKDLMRNSSVFPGVITGGAENRTLSTSPSKAKTSPTVNYNRGEINWVTGQGIDLLNTNKTIEEEVALLLDTYSGAAAAYSLRKLRTAYTGDAIRVRRANDNTEIDIGFDENGELDTTALIAFCTEEGVTDGFVVTWYDQSGSGNDATQAVALNQPQIVNAGVLNTEGGEPCVIFDGTNTFVETASNFISNTGLSLFTVHKFDSLVTKPQDIISQGASTSAEGFKYGMNGTGDDQYAVFYPSIYVASASTTQELQQIHSIIAKASGTTININAVSKTVTEGGTLDPQVGNNSDTLEIGRRDSGSAYFNGRLQEIIIYTSDQSFDRLSIEENINNQYNIY